MIYLNDYERGGIWVNKFHIVTINQQIRDCRITFTNDNVLCVLETADEVIEKIRNYDL
jgi:uncharacterized protein YlzI (FlbEa/FlbD family)